MHRLIAIAVLSTVAATPLAAPPAFSPDDVFALEWAERPQLSPDGKRIVYQRSFFDAMKDVRRSNLWLVDVGSGAQRPLTSGSSNDRGAVWSPDGQRIAYVASDGTSAQIFVRWLDGGETARVTRLQQSPGNLAWSPDGRLIAFTARIPATPTPLATDLPKPPKGAEWAAPMKVIERFTWRFDGAGEIEPGYSQVFVVAADGGAPRQVTQGEHDFDGPLAWTRDGKALILAANPVADAEYDPLESDLYRVAIADGALTRLTTRDGPDNSPAVSASGRYVAYVGFEDRRLGYQNTVLSVHNLETGATRALTAGFDRSIDNPQWDGDRGIWFQYDDRGVTKIGWIAASGGQVETVARDLGGTAMGRPYDGGSFHAVGGKVAYTHNSNERPADVAVVSRGAKPRVLTGLSENLLGARTLGRTEEITWKSSFDQRKMQGWMVKPPGFDPAKKYPLMLEIHGGPVRQLRPAVRRRDAALRRGRLRGAVHQSARQHQLRRGVRQPDPPRLSGPGLRRPDVAAWMR